MNASFAACSTLETIKESNLDTYEASEAIYRAYKADGYGAFILDLSEKGKQLADEAFEQAEAFQKLSYESKEACSLETNSQNGLMGGGWTEKEPHYSGSHPQRASSFSMRCELNDEKARKAGLTADATKYHRSPFPDETLPRFRSAFEALFHHRYNAAVQVMRTISRLAQSRYGEERKDKDLHERTSPLANHLLRSMHYTRKEATGSKTVGMSAHTDFEVVSMIEESCNGLHIHSETHGWQLARAAPGRPIVIAGDALERIFFGELKATQHSVENGSQCDRMSLVYFAPLSDEEYLSPLQSVVDSVKSRSELRRRRAKYCYSAPTQISHLTSREASADRKRKRT